MAAEALVASGRDAEKLSLSALQSKMKCDPEGYETELFLLYNQFKSSLSLFQQQAALSFTSMSGIPADPSVSKDLGDRVMFLAHVTPVYIKHLSEFPKQLTELLRSSARSLLSSLRCRVTQALILLVNRKIVDMRETLALFMELQTLGDRNLRKLAFSHVVHSIRRMNQKHKNVADNRPLQNILFTMLQLEDGTKAKRSLVVLCELHRRKVWCDDRTENAICTACFHSSSRIMIAALSFLLDCEKIEGDDDSDDSSNEDETPQNSLVLLNKEAIYKAHHKGTIASKRKKMAKLQRVIRSMKKQQRLSNNSNSSSNYHSPLNHLNDAQGFVEKLFSRLQNCNERFEVKMMMLKVIARTIGIHRLILLNFYDYLLKYVQPHQRDVTSLLAAGVQSCHDMVPPKEVKPLFRQIINQFVHDRSRPEAIAVGLNVTREICLRMPLLMTEDLLQELVLYKKLHEKAVSVAARSLMLLFREICPSLLVKKDRGRPIDPKARPKAFGEVEVLTDVPGIELLHHVEDEDHEVNRGNSEDESIFTNPSDGLDNDEELGATASDDDDEQKSMNATESDELAENKEDSESVDDDDSGSIKSDGSETEDEEDEPNGDCDLEKNINNDGGHDSENSKARKRKHVDFGEHLSVADTSLRALKRLASGAKTKLALEDLNDGFLSNGDFKQIKELKAKKEEKAVLGRHGLLRKHADTQSSFKIPSSDQLSSKRVDPAKLEAHIRQKLSKEERLTLVRAGREDRGKYQARTAVKQKKTGGSSNRQKNHKKAMPLAAKKAKIARSRQEKKRKERRSGKQFRGRKAWK